MTRRNGGLVSSPAHEDRLAALAAEVRQLDHLYAGHGVPEAAERVGVVFEELATLADLARPEVLVSVPGAAVARVGELTMLSGRWGGWKTSFAAGLCVRMAEGGGHLGPFEVRTGGPVLFADKEEHPRDLLDKVRGFSPSTPDGFRVWRAVKPLWGEAGPSDVWEPFWAAVEASEARLVVLGPHTGLVDQAGSFGVREFIDGVSERLEAGGAAGLLIAHPPKSAWTAGQVKADPVSGASAWVDEPRSVLVTLPEEDGTGAVLWHKKASFGKSNRAIASLRPRYSPNGTYLGVAFSGPDAEPPPAKRSKAGAAETRKLIADIRRRDPSLTQREVVAAVMDAGGEVSLPTVKRAWGSTAP